MADSHAPPERQRTTKACVACSIRKIKCDGNDPCAHCVRLFNSECFYTTAKKRGPPKGSPARGGHRKRSATNSSATNGGSSSPSDLRNGWLPDTNPGSSTASVATASGPARIQPPSINGGGESRQGGQRRPSHPHQQHPPPHQRPPPPAAPPQAHQNAAGGSSHPPSGLDVTLLPDYTVSPGDFSNTHGMFPPTAALQMSPASPVTSIPRSVPPTTPTADVSYAGQAGLSSEAIDDLLLVFETFIHPHWPAIYLPALRSFRSLETTSPLVFDAVLAISASNSEMAFFSQDHLLPTEKTSPRPLVEICESLTESLRHRVFASMHGRETAASLAMVQALMFVSMVDFGAGRTSLSYQMVGFACRMALDLGLHHYTLGLPQTSTSASDPRDHRNMQERCRTLWACFVLDKMVAAAAQRPPLLRLVDIDAPRPSVMERDELDLWLSGAAQSLLHPSAREPMECVKSHTLSSFSSWCDVMAILELILDQVYRPRTRRARMNGHHVDGYEEAVVYIDNELRKWRASLPEHLQWSDNDPQVHMHTGLHRLTVRGWYYCCMLLLHRPQVPYLDRGHSPPSAGAGDHEYIRRASEAEVEAQSHAHNFRLPNGAEAARHAATAICTIMENYEQTFKVRKWASSWVYLVFQAATVHAGLAAHGPGPSPALEHASALRAESRRRLEQCIGWLDEISMQWSNASRHVEILRTLSAVCATTRPPSPVPDGGEVYGSGSGGGAGGMTQFDSAFDDMNALDLDAWMLLWASMPTAGDDVSLWQQCFPSGPR